MMYRLLLLIGILAFSVLAFSTLAFTGAAWTAEAAAQAAQTQGAAPAADDPPPVLAVPPGYNYSPQGRRDPFVNPIPKPESTEPEVPAIRPPGLRGVLVNEAVIAGVVTSREPSMNLAVILAPGNKTYFASRNDTLFDAVVKDIQTDSVVFALTLPGRSAEPQLPPREIVRKVRTSGENQ
jgi:hypothetical protein